MRRSPRTLSNERKASELAACYEALRNQATKGVALIGRYGLVVLLRQGLAAWMEVWSKLPASRPRAAEMRHRDRRTSPMPDESATAVVQVLAAMSLGHWQEVHP